MQLIYNEGNEWMEVSLDESFSCAMELEVSLLAKTCVFKIQAVAQ